ncbi:hypothetical protein, partial [Photobacterium lucens]|uniref:hypothetical protein n=1 Tax=Photobacterium lucens TaxID=2562949 RepID=UPI001CA3EA11
AYSGMNLSYNANLLLNGHLTGNAMTMVDHNFLRAHIAIVYSTYFAWSSAFFIILYGILSNIIIKNNN